MDKGIKAQWITALRSGDYVQGTGLLRIPNDDNTYSYCCLGVLCDLAAKAGVMKWQNHPNDQTLPVEVMEWANLNNDVGYYDNGHLVHRNDIEHDTFEDIAELIEQYF